MGAAGCGCGNGNGRPLQHVLCVVESLWSASQCQMPDASGQWGVVCRVWRAAHSASCSGSGLTCWQVISYLFRELFALLCCWPRCWLLGVGVGGVVGVGGALFTWLFISARIFCCSLLFWCALLLAYCFGILVSFKKLSMQLKQKYLT
jgi:hypothetical protein